MMTQSTKATPACHIERRSVVKRIALTAAVVISATSAFAYGEDTIDANEAIQKNRIEQGRYNGQLTRREYRQLLAEQARIAEMERAAKADGRVSRREYRDIHDAQNEAYRHIKAENGDGQTSCKRCAVPTLAGSMPVTIVCGDGARSDYP
jgi:hypothetical protein